jgi:5,6,7,8-tetrahydromethanopterin hydro-lyase
MTENKMIPQYGESFVGDGVDAAHINTVLGLRDGPVGTAWATALATPSAGHTPFVAILRPGLPVQPFTLFVNKAAIADDEHGRLTWGAAQAGVAKGVAYALRDGVVPQHEVDQLALIVAVWVNPEARDEQQVFTNNASATLNALRAGQEGRPSVVDVLAAASDPTNPYFAG